MTGTGIPLHLQIRESLQNRVEIGEWPAQFRLPSEPELAAEFRVSRMTVRQAVQRLVVDGVLYRRRGVGTFVSPRPMERDLSRLTSFSEDAAARRVAARSEVRRAGREEASEHVAAKLDVPVGEAVTCVERLRFFEDTPVAVQTVWLPERFCVHLDDPAVACGSIYQHLEKTHNYRIGWGVQTIRARQPRRDERQILTLPRSAAVVCVERTTFLDDGTPIELSEAIYNSEEQSFTITLRR